MRIGILTFHRGNNYGGILQCYALQQVLKSMNHEVEIIDYKNTGCSSLLSRLYAKYSTSKSAADFVATIKDLFLRKRSESFDAENNRKSIQVFDAFRAKYLTISQPLDAQTIGEYANAHYNLIITGSDQVWTSLFDSPLAYMIDWQPLYTGKRMSYAACSAFDWVHGKQKKVLNECLNRFDILTVRDTTTQRLVQHITGKNPKIVPDPSLLYAYEEFVTNDEREPYILTYVLGDEIEGGHHSALLKIKKKVGDIPVYSIIIPCNSRDITQYADKVFEYLSPNQWVDLFAHASYVYTDSFHAIMFSLKFQKPFAAYYRNKIRSSRLIDLKNRGLKTIYSSVDDMGDDVQTYHESLLKGTFDLRECLSSKDCL